MNNDFHLSNFMPDISFPELPEIDIPTQHMFSDTQFEIIKKYVTKFQSDLDNEHEVGVLLTNFGQTTLMNVTHIGYEKSVLLVFKGYVNGRDATLIQHISQINFLLTSVPKEPDKPARRIGFDTSSAK